VPAFYQRPQSLDEVVEHTCVRVLDLFGLGESAAAASPIAVRRWSGLAPSASA
jgi:4-hydroxy-3-polyprenylbenzoate decarboxylase